MWAHVEAALEFTVTAQLHKHNLVKRETDEIEGFRDGSTSILGISHGGGKLEGESRATQPIALGGNRIRELCRIPDRD